MDHLYPFADNYEAIMKPFMGHLELFIDHYETTHGPFIAIYKPF